MENTQDSLGKNVPGVQTKGLISKQSSSYGIKPNTEVCA